MHLYPNFHSQGILNKEGNILRAIDRISYSGDTNNAAHLALRRAYRELFTTAGGSRGEAVKVSDYISLTHVDEIQILYK